jgi:hypothetical protein
MNKLIIVLIIAMVMVAIGFVFSGIVNATVPQSIGKNDPTHTDTMTISRNDTVIEWMVVYEYNNYLIHWQ